MACYCQQVTIAELMLTKIADKLFQETKVIMSYMTPVVEKNQP